MTPRRPGLRIGPNLTLPIDLAVEATAVIGKRGRGKTYTSKRIVEETLRAGVTVAVIDPTDVWWGLRSDADGGDGGLDVVVIGGKRGDLPLRPGTGKILARLVLEGTSVVLVTKGLAKAERRRMVAEFLTELYDNADGRPILVVIDEADEYAPQGGQSYGGNRRDDPLVASLGAVEDIVRRGRAGGLGSLLITQRVAVLNKNVLEQSDTIVALGVTGKNDIEAVEAWIGKHAANADAGRDLIRSLPGLPRGTAWVWSPEHDVLACVEVLPISTFDSSRTPKVGEVAVTPRARKSIDLAELGAEMEKFAEQVKADDPAELRKRIADLERQLDGVMAAPPVQRVEVPVVTDADRETVAKMVKAVEGAQTLIETSMRRWSEATLQLAQTLGERYKPPTQITITNPARAIKVADAATTTHADVTAQQLRVKSAATVVAEREVTAVAGGKPLSKAEDALLCALVARHPIPMTLRELGVSARRSHTSSTTQTAVSHLRALGLAEGDNRHLLATQAGVDLVGPVEPMPNDRDVVEWWCSRLSTAEGALLRTLVEAYPDELPNDAIAGRAGYSTTSSTFQTAMSRLRSLGLAVRVGPYNRAAQDVGEAWQRG